MLVFLSFFILLYGFILGGDLLYRIENYGLALIFFLIVHLSTAIALFFCKDLGYYLLIFFLLLSVLSFEWCFNYKFVSLISVGVTFDSNMHLGYFYSFLTHYEITFDYICDKYWKIRINFVSLLGVVWLIRNSDRFNVKYLTSVKING